MTNFNFKLPDLGEGLPDAEVIAWHVDVGDIVKMDQPLVSVETAKAIIDIPSPLNGVIEKLCAKPGEVIATGQVLVIFKTESNVKATEVGSVVGAVQSTENIFQETILKNSSTKTIEHNIKATPAVRALAKKLKIDINKITPTGPLNTITLVDVEKASIHDSSALVKSISDVDGWVALHQTARSMALAMQKSHNEVVPATIFEDLILPSYQDDGTFDITVNLIKAIVFACSKEPAINSWIVQSNNNFKQKIFSEINLGIAVDSSDGLFVPVIKNVSSKSSSELREELNLLLQQIKTRSLVPRQLQEATFILSNFGKFAGRYAIPVIVPPMVGILAVGSLRQSMVVLNGESCIKYVLPLSLTFDHRAVTGGQAARFLKAMLEFFVI
jgi:pyruvate dehydrogenase E2 component (dihydrolipoamide acetyltransferase)